MNRRENHDRLVKLILVALTETNLCRVWEQPTGAAYRDNQLIRYGVVGSADISGILKNGKRLEIEVKTGKAVQSDRQINFMRMINNMGGHYYVARSVKGAVEYVLNLGLLYGLREA